MRTTDCESRTACSLRLSDFASDIQSCASNAGSGKDDVRQEPQQATSSPSVGFKPDASPVRVGRACSLRLSDFASDNLSCPSPAESGKDDGRQEPQQVIPNPTAGPGLNAPPARSLWLSDFTSDVDPFQVLHPCSTAGPEQEPLWKQPSSNKHHGLGSWPTETPILGPKMGVWTASIFEVTGAL